MEKFAFEKGSAFTHNGDYFALVSVDGRLRIWDTTSGKLVQEFSPTSLVEASCTCLCWTKETRTQGTKSKEPKRKRKKTDVLQTESKYPSLVVGTTSGFILKYDPVAGEKRKALDCGERKTVNCIQYSSEEETLYTSTSDRYIREWAYDKEELKSKWKADKISVEMIRVGPSQKTLLSAGQSIKLWNLESKRVIQEFNGHSSAISILQFTPFSKSIKSSNSPDDGFYFLSGAKEDRIINVWQINSSKASKTPIASYMLSDVPLTVHSFVCNEEEKPLKLCAGCSDGKVHIFESVMNGKTSRPIESVKVVTVLEKERKKSRRPAKIFNLLLKKESSLILQLVFGNNVKPVFETMDIEKLDKNHEIIHDLSKSLWSVKSSSEDHDKPIENVKTNIHTQVLGNQNFVPVPQEISTKHVVVDINSNEEDRQKTETLAVQLSMEERLKGSVAEPVEENIPSKTKSKLEPSAGSFSQMLMQGLHSNDEQLLCDILFNSHSEAILRNTIKRIPNDMVGRLLSTIINKLLTNPMRSKALTIWLRVILSVHLSFIMMNEEIIKSISSLYQMLKSHEDIQPQLVRMQGKLDLLLHSALSHNNSSDEDDINNPAIVYNEESEDETEALFGKVIEESGDEGVSSDIDIDELTDEEEGKDDVIENGGHDDVVENGGHDEDLEDSDSETESEESDQF